MLETFALILRREATPIRVGMDRLAGLEQAAGHAAALSVVGRRDVGNETPRRNRTVSRTPGTAKPTLDPPDIAKEG
jgi:hypothetical protein